MEKNKQEILKDLYKELQGLQDLISTELIEDVQSPGDEIEVGDWIVEIESGAYAKVTKINGDEHWGYWSDAKGKYQQFLRPVDTRKATQQEAMEYEQKNLIKQV